MIRTLPSCNSTAHEESRGVGIVGPGTTVPLRKTKCVSFQYPFWVHLPPSNQRAPIEVRGRARCAARPLGRVANSTHEFVFLSNL